MQLFQSQCREFTTPRLTPPCIFQPRAKIFPFPILVGSITAPPIPKVAAEADTTNQPFLVNPAIRKKRPGDTAKALPTHHRTTKKKSGLTKKRKKTTTSSLKIRHRQFPIDTTIHHEDSHLLDGSRRSLLLLPPTVGSVLRTNPLPVWIPTIPTTAGAIRAIMVADTRRPARAAMPRVLQAHSLPRSEQVSR